MEAFEDLVMKEEQFLENVKIIYDAEALTASREIIRAFLLGQAIKDEEQNVMIKNEVTSLASLTQWLQFLNKKLKYIEATESKVFMC